MKKNRAALALLALLGVMNIDAGRKDETEQDRLFARSPEELESGFEGRMPREEGFMRDVSSSSSSSAVQLAKPIVQPVEKAGYSLTIIRKDTPIQGTFKEFQFNAEKQKLEGNVLDFKQYLSGSSNEYFGIPVEQQKLLLNGRELKNEDLLSTLPSSSTLYLEVIEKKSEKKPEEKEKAPALPSRSVKQQPKQQTISKPISQMTSREIGALDVHNLSEKQKEELVEIALFSGLESNRSAARKVIEQVSGKKDWTQEVKGYKDSILKEFKKSLGYQAQEDSSSKKMVAIKPIDKMTSREIGALKYENLSSQEQEQLFEMGLFSGLESNRSAARKVIDAYHKSKGMDPISWDKQLAEILAG